MSLRFSHSFLIFIVIFLVCSITPSAAIQTGNNSMGTDFNPNDQDDFLLQLYTTFYSTVFKAFDEGSNTELTPEQDAYLAQQEDRLLSKSEAMLNNSQDFLNYWIDEDYYYHPEEYENITPELRNGEDKYTEDAKEMRDYLNELDGIDVQHIQCNYGNLSYEVKNESLNASRVIVQIKDADGYIRYLQLISIDNETIHLVSGNVDINVPQAEFDELYVWHNDGRHENNDREFNILVSPPDYNYTDHLLRQIWDKQNADLGRKKSVTTGVAQIIVVVMGAVGLSMMVAGIYKMCKDCRKKAGQDMNQLIPEPNYEAAFDVEAQVFKVKNAVTDAYRRIADEKDPAKRDGASCNICSRRSFLIFISGLGIVLACVGGELYLNTFTSKYDIEMNNLKQYEPPMLR